MIEVEKKFQLSKEQEEQLIEGAEPIGELTNHDVYYDLPDLRFSKQCCWLRNRNGRFELKWRARELQRDTFDGVTMYDEIEDESKIADKLQIPYSGNLANDLRANNFTKLGEYTVNRRSFRNDNFRIDLDETDFGYCIAEIERLVDDISKKDEALEEIHAFMQAKHLHLDPAHGKLLEYLKRNSPEHFKALQHAGII